MYPLLIITYSLVGIIMGLFYYVALWWTVNRTVSTGMSHLWIVVSFFARSAIVVAGFYFILTAGWVYLVLALGGFLVARLIVTMLVKKYSSRIQ